MVPGVGLYNAASGMATAYARSSSILVIAGQIPRERIGKDLGTVHEIMNQSDVVRPVHQVAAVGAKTPRYSRTP